MTVDVSTIDYAAWLEEDMDCPLCMEELDITDKLFKPCECGYQVRILFIESLRVHFEEESIYMNFFLCEYYHFRYAGFVGIILKKTWVVFVRPVEDPIWIIRPRSFL